MSNEKYMKAIESLGELLILRDKKIQLNDFDLERKEKKIKTLNEEINRLNSKLEAIEKTFRIL